MQRLWRNLILALGLGVAVYLALALLSGFGDLREALADFRLSLLPVILGLVAVSYVVRFLRWLYYLRLLDVEIPPGYNAAIFTAGLSMTISPGKIGEVLKSVFIRQVSGDPVARTAPAVVAERTTDGTGMLAWGMLGALALSLGLEGLLLFLLLVVVGVALLRSRWFWALTGRALGRLPLLRRLVPHLESFHASSNLLLATIPLGVGTAFSCVAWGFEMAAVYLCVMGIGAEVPFLLVVFIFAVSSIAGALSMTPGGIGVAEAGLAGMFVTLAGLAGGTTAALTILIRAATLWFATLLGIAGLLLVRAMIGTPGENVNHYTKAEG